MLQNPVSVLDMHIGTLYLNMFIYMFKFMHV